MALFRLASALKVLTRSQVHKVHYVSKRYSQEVAFYASNNVMIVATGLEQVVRLEVVVETVR